MLRTTSFFATSGVFFIMKFNFTDANLHFVFVKILLAAEKMYCS